MDIGVLLIGYRRTEAIKNRLREILKNLDNSPQNFSFQIFISIDGSDQDTKVKMLKIIFDFEKTNSIKLKTRILDSNLGLSEHITTAVSWVLEKVSNIIVIEDDIQISNYLLPAMSKQLSRFSNTSKPVLICGYSPLNPKKNLNYFNFWRQSQYFSVWGWASNKIAWEKYKLKLEQNKIEIEMNSSSKFLDLSSHKKQTWIKRFEKVAHFPDLTWDIQMQYAVFKHNIKVLQPVFTLVNNLGFNDPLAAHTKEKMPRWMRVNSVANRQIQIRILILGFAKILDFINSSTFIGDSRTFHFWQKIRTSNR